MDNIPEYYYRNGVEVREVLDKIYQFFGDSLSAKEGALMFNIIKYLLRYKFKDNPVADLDKLHEYLTWLKQLELEKDD